LEDQVTSIANLKRDLNTYKIIAKVIEIGDEEYHIIDTDHFYREFVVADETGAIGVFVFDRQLINRIKEYSTFFFTGKVDHGSGCFLAANLDKVKHEIDNPNIMNDRTIFLSDKKIYRLAEDVKDLPNAQQISNIIPNIKRVSISKEREKIDIDLIARQAAELIMKETMTDEENRRLNQIVAKYRDNLDYRNALKRYLQRWA